MSEAKRQKGAPAKSNHADTEKEDVDVDGGLEFEDPYGDDLDDEEQQELERAVASAAEEDWSEESESEEMDADEDEDEDDAERLQVWRPGVDTLGEDEILECDASAYEFLHRLQTAWPCLSFDFIPDSLGAARTKCPHTCYAVGGTQSEEGGDGLYIMKWHRLHKTQHDDDSSLSEEESDEEESEEDAKLEFRIIAHKGAVNRMPRLTAAWSDMGVVGVWDIDKHLKRLDEPGAAGPPPDPHQKPMYEFKGHGEEGFAMDWNPLHVGKLLSGDVAGQVFLWLPREGGWDVQPLFQSKKNKGTKKGPLATVEELQWKPLDDGKGEIFAASSNDGSIKLWDLRIGCSSPSAALIDAHNSDINAMRFSPLHAHLILSGDEEGNAKVFDLRCPQMPLSEMEWHKKPITCVDWHPSDEAVFAVSSLDDSLTIWDMSVEREGNAQPQEGNLPEQLMFVHGGQQHISELHFHPQIPGCIATTASDGFNVFKTSNI
ncbi:wd g-beta repeat-containing protein [Cyclospora cayetanensis]|uniref:Wd g-beta repeat-containing protein n=1 Tax=Cyclospora cayetanensis TaxID=88456 RepID=A0A1D3CRW5_9EIME|nr:wd g-beta repeat-containing protein [Cyclospora cayetanensis]